VTRGETLRRQLSPGKGTYTKSTSFFLINTNLLLILKYVQIFENHFQPFIRYAFSGHALPPQQCQVLQGLVNRHQRSHQRPRNPLLIMFQLRVRLLQRPLWASRTSSAPVNLRQNSPLSLRRAPLRLLRLCCRCSSNGMILGGAQTMNQTNRFKDIIVHYINIKY